MNIDFRKNVWRCSACGESGGILRLHGSLNHMDLKQAFHDLNDRWNRLPEVQRYGYLMESERRNSLPVQMQAGPVGKRNAVYASLLYIGTLSRTDRRDLARRGLTDSEIARFGYKSVPQIGLSVAAEHAYRMAGIDIMTDGSGMIRRQSDIPGFWYYGDRIMLTKRRPGYYVPVRNICGLISGMQIRNHEPKDPPADSGFHKYSWLSSSEKPTGCSVSGIEQIHHTFRIAGSSDSTPETVFLTEGALKADIASALSGSPYIALTGINNISQLPEELEFLKEHGTKRIMIAVDMDYRTKPEVASALKSITEMIGASGLAGTRMEWDGRFKGIDDWLLHELRNTGKR